LDIQLNKNILQPYGPLVVKVDYKDGGGQILNQSLATPELIVENEEAMLTRLHRPSPTRNLPHNGNMNTPSPLVLLFLAQENERQRCAMKVI
jgi:hypothetical protein